MAMIICMDYTQDGERTITQSIYKTSLTETEESIYANDLANEHDEVYIIPFDPNDKELIKEVALHGCRM